MKITREEIEGAVLKAAPRDGQTWSAEEIADQLVALVQAEADEERRRKAAWETGRNDFDVRFVSAGVEAGDAVAVLSIQAEAAQRHGAAVQARVTRNKAIIQGIGASLVALGTSALGGAGAAALLPAAIGIARQIAAALNDEAA